MSAINEPGSSDLPTKRHPASRARGRENPAHDDHETFTLENSVITLEAGPAGTVAQVERADAVDYAGPLPPETIAALREVAA